MKMPKRGNVVAVLAGECGHALSVKIGGIDNRGAGNKHGGRE